MRELLLNGPPETDHVSIVIDNLESAEFIVGIGQVAMHGDLVLDETLCT